MTTLEHMCAHALERDASAQAIEFEGHWYSWGEVRHVAERVLSLLKASGAGADAPVTFVPRNRPSAVATLVALMSQGRNIRMIYAFQSAAGVIRDIERLQSQVVIADEEDFAPEIREYLQAQGIAGIALADMDAHVVSVPGEGRAAAGSARQLDPQIEILTSGTTGPPKQFPISYAMIAKFLGVGTSRMEDGRDYAKDAPALLYFPLGNISGIYSTVPTLLRGQRVVLLDRFSIDKWRDYVVRYRPVTGGLPPAGVQMLLDANIVPEDISSLKALGTGAAPLDPSVQRAFEERYHIPILLSYGATEFAGPVTGMTLELHAEWGEKKFGTVGRPIGGAQLRVIDPGTGHVLPAGTEGILEVISPRIGPDWIRTSDIAVIDEDGFLFHRGRADGAIMRGGFKILPETIERALLLHPAVSAAGVVGIADKRLGQVPGAVIQIRPGEKQPAISELEAHLRENVLATHIPVHWCFVETLPKTPSFKIDRPALGRLLEAEEVS